MPLAPVAGPVTAAYTQLVMCHEDTALAFSDFNVVCNVSWRQDTWSLF